MSSSRPSSLRCLQQPPRPGRRRSCSRQSHSSSTRFRQECDGDGVANGCDVCAGLDADLDDVCDPDLCPGGDDRLDGDGDGVPDACDSCEGSDDTVDLDADGVPSGCDQCPWSDDSVDPNIRARCRVPGPEKYGTVHVNRPGVSFVDLGGVAENNIAYAPHLELGTTISLPARSVVLRHTPAQGRPCSASPGRPLNRYRRAPLAGKARSPREAPSSVARMRERHRRSLSG